MQWYKNLKLGPRLVLIFAAIVVMMLVQTGISWMGMARMDTASKALVSQNMARMQTLGQLRADVTEMRNASYQYLLRASDEVRQSGRDEAQARREAIQASIAAFSKQAAGSQTAAPFATFSTAWDKALVSYDEVTELVDLELADDAIDVYVSQTRSLHLAAAQALGEVARIEAEQATRAEQTAAEAYSVSLLGLILAMLIGTGSAAALVVMFVRALTSRMRTAVRIANEVAGGNLDGRIVIDGKDEVADLLVAMSRMQSDLRERIAREASIAAGNLRIRNALEASSTAVYLSDANFEIVFANPALGRMLSLHADVFSQALPELAGRTDPVGLKVSAMESDGQIDPQVLAQLQRDGHVSRSQLYRNSAGAQVHLQQYITAIRNADGQVLGFFVECRDRTDDVAIEQELATVIAAAADGALDHRISVDGKAGFHLTMADNLNRLLSANELAMGKLSGLLSALADGDLTARMEGDFQGLFARMRDDANATASQLASIVSGIAHSAAEISQASGEIASGNQDLSRRTEQQAANLEETAASMEELTSTVRQNAEHARQANQLAVGAADVAAKGGQVTQSMVGTMEQISQSSRKIGDIISVIDGIAFQTNILALNAAVEAARAGEQGRGFAVVASEVRTLAQRSAGAAKEIKTLIDDSVAKVADGTRLVSQAGSTMEEIVVSVQRVTDIMAEISAASQEQSSGIEQVSQTVMQMDQATQQNAALVEEATAAARAMEDQARQLSHAVASFKVASGQAAIGTRAQPAGNPLPAATDSSPAAAATAHTARPGKANRRSGSLPAVSAAAARVKQAVSAGEDNWQEF